MIERNTGKLKKICELPKIPKMIKLCGDWLIVIFENRDFMLFNISSPSIPFGQACKGSLAAAFENQDGHLTVQNGKLLYITSNQRIFVGSIQKRKWIEAILPNLKFSKFPAWLFPTLSSTTAAFFNQAINRISSSSLSQQHQQRSTFIPPSDNLIRALILPSEFQFFNFINDASSKLKESSSSKNYYQCKHFKNDEKNECQICQIFYLLTKFSLNLDITNKAIEY